MSAVNNFLPFCPNNTGTNLESQAAYAADTNRTNGNQPGVASSNLNNKALRQGTYIASQVAQMIMDTTNMGVLDNATPAQLLAQMLATLKFLPPQITKYTSSSGNYNAPYAFFIATGSATVAATYTDSGSTVFTVLATVASGTLIYATGNTAPVTGAAGGTGTLTKTGGTGDSTITYYAVRAPLCLEIEMVGGGAGGGAAATNAGADGGDTTFGDGTAAKGAGSGAGSTTGGAGGTATLGTGWVGLSFTGANGFNGGGAALVNITGGAGGASFFGGQGAPTTSTGGAAKANTGSGGAGAADSGVGTGGGGAGGYIRAYISAPASTYAYGVGAAGAGGAAGTVAGGNGAAGVILVTAQYQ